MIIDQKNKKRIKHPNMFFFMKPDKWEVSEELDYLTKIFGHPVAYIHIPIQKKHNWINLNDNPPPHGTSDEDSRIYFIIGGRLYMAKNGDMFMYEVKYKKGYETHDRSLRIQFTKKIQVYGRFMTKVILSSLKIQLKIRSIKNKIKTKTTSTLHEVPIQSRRKDN